MIGRDGGSDFRWTHRQAWPHASSKFARTRRFLTHSLFYTSSGEEVVSSLEMSCRLGHNAAEKYTRCCGRQREADSLSTGKNISISAFVFIRPMSGLLFILVRLLEVRACWHHVCCYEEASVHPNSATTFSKGCTTPAYIDSVNLTSVQFGLTSKLKQAVCLFFPKCDDSVFLPVKEDPSDLLTINCHSCNYILEKKVF